MHSNDSNQNGIIFTMDLNISTYLSSLQPSLNIVHLVSQNHVPTLSPEVESSKLTVSHRNHFWSVATYMHKTRIIILFMTGRNLQMVKITPFYTSSSSFYAYTIDILIYPLTVECFPFCLCTLACTILNELKKCFTKTNRSMFIFLRHLYNYVIATVIQQTTDGSKLS